MSRQRSVFAITSAVLASTFLVVSASTEKVTLQRADLPPGQARVSKLLPTADTEMVLDDMFIATDGRGHRRVIASGPLPTEKREAMLVILDGGTEQYHVVRLHSNPQSDAKRIQAIYRRFGVEMAEQKIVEQLLRKNAAIEERTRRFLADKGIPIEGQARFFGQSACEPVVEGRGPFAEEEPQMVWRCHDWGYSDIQLWEPARYVIPVAELAQTVVYAEWLHDTSQPTIDSINTYGYCWANPDTFIGTHWDRLFCTGSQPEPTRWYNGFDVSTTGQYQNTDFVRQFVWLTTQTWLPYSTTVTVTSTGSVQFNDIPRWEHQEIIDYENYDSWFWWLWFTLPGFGASELLTFKVSGFAGVISCAASCEPTAMDLDLCDQRNQTDFPHWGYGWDYDECTCKGAGTPVIIDLNGDGIALTNVNGGVTFDLLGSGKPVRTSWTTQTSTDDAFLVLDRNGNGVIDGGTELFGDMTPQPKPEGKGSSKKAGPNGFLALAVYDQPDNGGNGDEQITEADAIYGRLRLWIDGNHDGISQASEMRTLDGAGVRAIMLRYVTGKKVDEFGNAFRYRSYVLMDRDVIETGALPRRAVDVLLTYTPLDK